MAVGPPRMKTVFTSNPSAAKKPNSCATTRGNVPLNVGVLAAKFTGLASTHEIQPEALTAKESSNAMRIILTVPLKSSELFSASERVPLPLTGQGKFSQLRRVSFRLLQIQRACREEFFHFHFLRSQPLLVRKVDKRLQHLAVGFDAVRIGVVAEHPLGHGQIFAAKKQG